jgi:hypothetical protein
MASIEAATKNARKGARIIASIWAGHKGSAEVSRPRKMPWDAPRKDIRSGRSFFALEQRTQGNEALWCDALSKGARSYVPEAPESDGMSSRDGFSSDLSIAVRTPR